MKLIYLSSNNQCVLLYIVVDCGIPPEIEHGQFNLLSNATYYGAAVLYECDDHFELSGFGRRLCLENGSWSAETPTCKGEITIMNNVKRSFWKPT